MPSSKNSPGPHDRKPESVRERCKFFPTRTTGKRCTHYAAKGCEGFCQGHYEKVKHDNGAYADRGGGDPQPTLSGVTKGGMTKQLNRQGAGALRLTEQARQALRRLGNSAGSPGYDPSSDADPKTVLLDAVRSSHTQRQIWEALLASTPEEDFDLVGTPPIPGSKSSSRGARIEIIQRQLEATTKSAARISKMAIDAGIEERMVRLAEAQEALIADTVRAGLIAAINSMPQLSEAARELAIQAALSSAATHLRQLAATAGDVTIIKGVSQAVREIPA